MTTATRPKITFEELQLAHGAHRSPDKGLCFLEAVAYFKGLPHSDEPPCVSPAIADFGRAWNDALDDEGRQLLKPYIFKVLNTATTPEDEERRAWMATDWLVRVFTPTWLDLAGLGEHANKLRDLPELTTDELATAAQDTISAAESAAGSAAWSAAGSAARSAARSAAWSAAESAAGSAAWSAAWSAARSAARSAAWSAARSAAGSAAWSAAWSAARSAAAKALAPTVALLQKSALALLDRMIAVGRTEEPQAA